MSILEEGLKKGDLEGMVLPMISIDEFDSKIDNNRVIVVAFYCFEEDPAHDLANFVERSPTAVIDTDVSPAPSKEGYYVTFVEIKRNVQFPQNLIKILNEISNLTLIDNWQFTSYQLHKGKIMPVDNSNLAKWVNLKPKADDDQEKLQEFLQHSCLTDFVLEQDQLTLMRQHQQCCYQFGGVVDQLEPAPALLETARVAEANRLQRLLDGPYSVIPLKQGMVVENHLTHNMLVLLQDNH